MSYCRFGDDSDVYVFTSSYGLECCGCIMQKVVWVENDTSPIGGYLEPVGEKIETVFQSNADMIAHLELHRSKGHKVPERALERLRDPKDAAKNREIWNEHARGR